MSFDVEDHQQQIKQYLSDGFSAWKKTWFSTPAGKLGEQGRVYPSQEPLVIAGDNLYFNYDEGGRGSKRCLNFNRANLPIFRQRQFSIFYSGEAQSFVMASQLHRKEFITPKTVFLVIPEGVMPFWAATRFPGEIAQWGQHIVLPGLAFKVFSRPSSIWLNHP